MGDDAAPFSSILDDLKRSGGDKAVSAGDILERFEHRSLGVLLTVLAFIALLPVIGGIPGVSVVTGTLILIAVAQSVLGGGALWMPDFVRRREIARDTFDGALDKVQPWIGWADRLLKPRLRPLVAGRAQRWAIAAAAALLALAFYPLAVIPFGVTAPALGVLALGLGLMAGDGLLVLAGYCAAAVTAWLVFWIL